VQLEPQALKVTRAIKVMSVLRVQLELKATKVTSARQELQALKVTRAIKVISVLRVQLELQALKVTRAIKVM
jgi:hypothetical protein